MIRKFCELSWKYGQIALNLGFLSSCNYLVSQSQLVVMPKGVQIPVPSWFVGTSKTTKFTTAKTLPGLNIYLKLSLCVFYLKFCYAIRIF